MNDVWKGEVISFVDYISIFADSIDICSTFNNKNEFKNK